MAQTDYIPLSVKEHLREWMDPAPNHSGNNGYICPVCGSGSHRRAGSTGAVQFNPSGPSGPSWYCHACGARGDILDYIAAQEAITPEEARELLKKEYPAEFWEELAGGSSAPKPKKKTAEEQQPSFGTNYQQPKPGAWDKARAAIEKAAAAFPGSPAEAYMKQRGFTEETLQLFCCGWDPGEKRVILPYSGQKIGLYAARAISEEQQPKYKKLRAADYGGDLLYNPDALEAAAILGEYLFLTEGPLDAMSIEQAGGAAASFLGTGGAGKIALYRGKWPDKIIYVADNDDPGKKAAEAVKKDFAGLGVFAAVVFPPASVKDANDLLQADPEELARLVSEVWPAEAKKQEAEARANGGTVISAADLAAVFWTAEELRPVPTPSGFPSLDNILSGGFVPGLYILGAVSSMGKSAFALQLADNIAASGRPVLYVSVEMSAQAMLLRSLSRLTFQRSKDERLAKSAAELTLKPDLLTPAERDLIEAARVDYLDRIAGNLFFLEGWENMGAGKIREAVEDFIEQHAGARPFLIVDYLQILPGSDPRMTDKQATDENVYSLKRLSRDLRLPVLGIASLNRGNYTSDFDLDAFKESGSIEYTADIIFGLLPAGLAQAKSQQARSQIYRDAKSRSPRTVDLKIIKNRSGGFGSGAVAFRYDAKYNCFEEALLSGFDEPEPKRRTI